VHDEGFREIPDDRTIHCVEPTSRRANDDGTDEARSLLGIPDVSRLPHSVGAMHLRGSVLTREPILDAPTTVARSSGAPVGAGVILARVAAASYLGTLAAWSAGILVLGAARHGADAFVAPGPPEAIAVYLGTLVALPLATFVRQRRPEALSEAPPSLAAGGPLK